MTQLGYTCHPKMTGGSFVFNMKCDSLELLFVIFLFLFLFFYFFFILLDLYIRDIYEDIML